MAKKAIVIFGSSTGNTELLAGVVEKGFKEDSFEVTTKNVAEVNPAQLRDYDLIAFGSSTWGDGELQADFIDFYEQLSADILKEKKVCVFGPGDSSYEQFCKAIDLIEAKVKECGGQLAGKSFKVDGEIDSVLKDAQDWAKAIASSLPR